MAADTSEGEFRVPEDVEAERAAEAALLTDAAAADPDSDGDEPDGQPSSRRFPWRRARAVTDGDATDPDATDPDATDPDATDPDATDHDATTEPGLPEVDITTTPGTVVAAVALGVVAAPLLGVYAVLFITRYFLQPGVAPDITSSWTGEGIAGIVAALLAIAMLVIVARAAGGRALPVFVGAQVLVVGASAYLLSDDANGGRSVTIVVLVLALGAIVSALVPGSRRWFAAHAADRAADE